MGPIAEEQKTISDLCIEVLRDCRGRLIAPAALEDEGLVHDLRVATKRLRAAWHLTRGTSDTKFVKERRNALRELSAHLSFRRDVAVLENLTASLSASRGDADTIDVLDRVRELLRQKPILSAQQPCPDGLFEEVRTCLDQEIDAWKAIDWGTPDHARKAIRRSLRRATGKVRQKTRNALKNRDPKVWHKWRKAIKKLRYQREFVAEANGRKLGKFDERVSRLGTALGDRNDLANLLSFGKREAELGHLGKKDLNVLFRIVGQTERDLLRNCRRRGRRLMGRR